MAQPEEQGQTIRSLFIPLAQEYIAITGLEDDDHWLLGRIGWRNMELPLLSMERLMVGTDAEPGLRSRIIIIKAVGNPPGMPYFGIVARQIPRLVTVQEATIEPLDDVGEMPGVQSQVLANGEPALVPDLESVVQRLYEVLHEVD
jgi:chemosensory pili system protein ChpC